MSSFEQALRVQSQHQASLDKRRLVTLLSHEMKHASHALFTSHVRVVISKAVKRKNPQHKVLGIYRLL
ncbi:hypothetical protein, partial [Shewanella sp. UCD-KL12]|uniref:hypothetical protein n=1 Tax=Shewanella sp. UCD-KL12 TaxID=1917163 RepID=UPI001C4C2E02